MCLCAAPSVTSDDDRSFLFSLAYALSRAAWVPYVGKPWAAGALGGAGPAHVSAGEARRGRVLEQRISGAANGAPWR
jgi:hypothetical protein